MTTTLPPRADPHARTVLLVGFGEAEAARISGVLGEVGHEPLAAKDGRDAARIVGQRVVDLALADLEGRFREVMGAIEALREAGCPLLGVGSLESTAAMTDGLRVLGLEGTLPAGAAPQELVFRVNAVLFADRAGASRPNRRVPVDLAATFDGPEGVTAGRILNLSDTGLFLAASQILPVNRTVNVHVTLGAGEPLTATCRVVWANARDDRRRYFQGMGLQILQMRPAARTALDRFLRHLRSGAAEGGR